jgi:hypothetical protein
MQSYFPHGTTAPVILSLLEGENAKAIHFSADQLKSAEFKDHACMWLFFFFFLFACG